LTKGWYYPSVEDDKRISKRVRGSCVGQSQKKNRVLMLQSQDLRVDQEKEPCIGFTQENSIENSIQNHLPLKLNYDSLCYYFSSLP